MPTALHRPRPSSRRLLTVTAPVFAVALLATSCLTPPPKVAVVTAQAAAAPIPPRPVEDAPYSGPTEAYTWKSVAMAGGGFVTGLFFSPLKQGILYARTDVGGAYRYDDKTKRWIPLTDSLNHKQGHYMGIESIALDPTNADRVYMAVGMYTQSWAGTGAIMHSDDRGETWKIIPVDFKMGGNELSRSDGERLAVDPNQPKVLYFGSRRNGLLKSEDSAETWKKVDSFPVADDAEKGLGLPIVLFDGSSGKPGAETPTIFVGTQTDGKIYRSKDAGKTWAAVPNQPALGYPPRRAALDRDGALYVTYAFGDSPYALSKGAVYKCNTKTDAWQDITPLKQSEGDGFGYAGISVDPSKTGTLIVATMDRWSKEAEIFRTRDGGKTWKPLMATAKLDGGGVAHVYHHREKLSAPQWLGDIQIDPFDPKRAMLVEGGGVWATWDLTAADSGKPTHWSFHSNNLEELCMRDLVSPPEGPPLVSVMLDACGMRHDDLDVSPKGGIFQNPMCASADDIDFAGKRPHIMVRVGSHPWDGSKAPRGAISKDSGTTWKPFATEPAGCGGMGSVAISADGQVILWAPRDGHAAVSRDEGKTWTKVEGLPAPTQSPDWASWFLRLASDPVNPKRFYAFNALAGEILRSVDGVATFKMVNNDLKAAPDYELHFTGIKAVPGIEGDIWAWTKSGLVRSTNGGESFSDVDVVQEAHGLGFGKAAPGKTFPAVYLSGKVGNQVGFFRSDDEGKHFTRINDDHHQYGGATVVTGDPRVYGRVYIGPGGRGILYGDPKK
jgi:photosystem II stability/assembly factor-like uncharacterized protein